ncbi:MAG: VOC family protein [Rhodobacter sp.]|nr:VOC family protein [Rhodobacter sp.]MCA3514881.1 VOC family protein [Rhodobacter sp.]MCA3520192.1 VOC family protein [Rhodobacter sp.]MCA3522123.1 VOC family protein [Rhodobacter sp.]MCA3524697.1 VOC family protein [Rhodobacter sp.]
MTAHFIPRLCLRDTAAAAEQLAQVFGFRADGKPNRLRLGDQIIELQQDADAAGQGRIDHLALAVDDVDAALAAALARGGELDGDVTPDGPQFIPEFWTAGTRYVFLKGPEGARIELCSRPGSARPGLPGHDHIGIPCADLPAMQAFFRSLGCTELAAVTLIRAGGKVPVAFLGLGPSVIELYCPPDHASATAAPLGHWRGLVCAGADLVGRIAGPEGIVIDGQP